MKQVNPSHMSKKRNKNILSAADFAKRMFKYTGFAAILVVVSLGTGILGYHFIAQLSWIDSLYNASMILTGMGPAAILTTTKAKVFSSVYAIFSGVVFLSTVGIFFSPIAHRLLHLLHVDDDETE